MTVHDLPQAEQLPLRYGLRVETPAEFLATVKKEAALSPAGVNLSGAPT